MDFAALLSDKGIKAKEKTTILSEWVLQHPGDIPELIAFAQTAKDSPKATCIEALEFATKSQPAIATLECLEFVTATLSDKAPRVKWESAKVIGNIAALFPGQLDMAIAELLVNTEHEGTVVRWSAAYALGQIILLKLPVNKDLLPAAEAICAREEQNSIRKIYLAAIKKAAK